MKYFLSTLTLLLFIYHSDAQQGYWQQRVDTRIDVTLDDNKNFLYAYEEMTYTNNSPDTLHYLYIHLWPNAYKNDRTPLAQQFDRNGQTNFYYSKPGDRGYIDSLQFMVDDKNVDFVTDEKAPDIARIDLLTPLAPGASTRITTPFRVKIPVVFSRLGHTAQAYFISQWFPKPAVYDQKGWHPISYLDQGEFYSNFGSYDVYITLPKNYVLMATGNCMTEREKNWMDSLATAPLPDPKIYDENYPASELEKKTVHYHENNIHDFAWFADKRYVVRKDTVSAPGTQLITTWTAFLPKHQQSWAKGNKYLKETVQYYGQWVGPYPYETIKAVEGDMHAGGGMEYPTVTIIDRTAISSLKTVIVHEAGHNWFYGMLGTNERDHAWMDEGINSFYEHKATTAISLADHGDSIKIRNKSTYIHKDSTKVAATIRIGDNLDKIIYYEAVSTHTDQPIETTSAAFAKINYPGDIYIKTPLMLDWLEDYIGKDDFEAGMHDYFNTWQYKHPYPEDFRVAMQRHTAKSLDWFFNDIMNTNECIDYKITAAHAQGGNTRVTICNKSDVHAPVKIEAWKDGKVVATSWSLPFTGDTTISLPLSRDQWTTLRIADVIADGKSTNNTYNPSSPFHRFGVKVRPLAGLNLSDKDKLFIAPALGYNKYDGFQVGLLFHDLTIPENHFRYAIAPMYATNSNSITGVGSMAYFWYPDNFVKEISLQLDGKSFSYDQSLDGLSKTTFDRYTKLAPSLNFIFNEHDPSSPVTRMLTLKGYYITEQSFVYSGDPGAKAGTTQQEKEYALLRYRHGNERVYNPFNYSIEGQLGADFAKINLEGNIRIDYFKKNKALYVRGYIGKFFPIGNDAAASDRYDLNATFSGMNDYLYDDTYFGRNMTKDAASQQISMREGGFKIPTFNNVGRSSDWMATLNLKTDLPLGRLPLRLFFDAGLIPNTTPDINNPSDVRTIYDGGIELFFYKDIVCVYFPLIMSSDFRDYLKNTYGNNNAFTRSISFTLNLQNINWLKLPSKAIKLGMN